MGRPAINVDNVVQDTRHILQRSDLTRVYVKTVARRLGMSARTLTRGLVEAGTTFLRLKEAERADRLREAIEDAPGSEPIFLAELCGFTQPRAFALYFKRVIGCTYQEHRAAHGLPPISVAGDLRRAEQNAARTRKQSRHLEAAPARADCPRC